jgi:hypothetical protein
VAVGVYAGADGRVAVWGCENSILPDAAGDEFLFPEFFPLFGWNREKGVIEIFDGQEGGCLLFFDQGGSLPTDIVGLNSLSEDPGFQAEVESSFLFLGRTFRGMDSLHKLTLEEAASDSRGRFRAVVAGPEGENHSWSTSDESLWKADLRPSDEILNFRKEKKAGERIWLGARIAVGFVLLLCLGQVALWGLDYWVGQKEDTRQLQAPLVQGVEERANLASRLNDLGESRVSVFERLGDLNLVRPDGIQFLDVKFEEPDIFQVEGRVTNVRILNEFVDRLKTDSRFLVTEAPAPRSRDGRVEFDLSVRVPNQKGERG